MGYHGSSICESGRCHMSSRVIRSQGGGQSLQDYLISMFITELIQPSSEIYFIFPYLSNYPLMDNRFNQYTALIPFAKGATIYLTDILEALVFKGSDVRVICNPERKETRLFIDRLEGRVQFKKLENNHDKVLVSEKFYLHGSMNFTYRGIHVNRESVRITTFAPEVNSALLAARERWKESLNL
jgi:phosphatidylserine/phosphatidylglycerophosphate/cardiolipin synthase-like enzyme